MKLSLFLFTGIGLLAVPSVSSAAILFADTFNRTNNTNLNAEATGKTGTLGALNWLERNSPSIAANALISGNTLKLGEDGSAGSGYSLAYVNHNFTDSIITTGGEFTVSYNLMNPTSGGNTRLTGLVVGNSSTELSGWSKNDPATFTSDFFIGYDPTAGGLAVGSYIYDGGTQVYSDTTTRASGTTYSVRFYGITDFNAGSTVSYDASINGSSVKTGSFTWTGTDENYIGFYSNYNANGGSVDNFSITTIPEPSNSLLGGLGMLLLLRRRRCN